MQKEVRLMFYLKDRKQLKPIIYSVLGDIKMTSYCSQLISGHAFANISQCIHSLFDWLQIPRLWFSCSWSHAAVQGCQSPILYFCTAAFSSSSS